MCCCCSDASTSAWFHSSLLCEVWQSYCAALAANPLTTKVCTGLVGTFVGDLIAQYSAHVTLKQQASPFSYDAARCLRFMVFSAIIGTPLSHCWYAFLDAHVLGSTPTAPLAVGLKVFLDQAVQTPLGMALFFAALKTLENQPDQVLPTLRCKLLPSLLANWTVWPLAQLINFTVVPLDMRILYVNVIAIAWTAYISNVASQQTSPDQSTRMQQEDAASDTALATTARMPLVDQQATKGSGSRPTSSNNKHRSLTASRDNSPTKRGGEGLVVVVAVEEKLRSVLSTSRARTARVVSKLSRTISNIR